MKEYQTNCNDNCRFQLKWTLLKLFSHCFYTDKFDGVNHAIQPWEIFQLCIVICGNKQFSYECVRSYTDHDPSENSAPHCCLAAKHRQVFHRLCYGVVNQETSPEKMYFFMMAVAFKKCYIIRLRQTKKGLEFASIGHLEMFSMSSGERLRKSRNNLKRAREVQEVLERQNRST